jgi:hypothetical protein
MATRTTGTTWSTVPRAVSSNGARCWRSNDRAPSAERRVGVLVDRDGSDIRGPRRWEFLVDLRRTEADLWSELSSTHRRQARRTLEGGATLECLRTGGGRILAKPGLTGKVGPAVASVSSADFVRSGTTLTRSNADR